MKSTAISITLITSGLIGIAFIIWLYIGQPRADALIPHKIPFPGNREQIVARAMTDSAAPVLMPALLADRSLEARPQPFAPESIRFLDLMEEIRSLTAAELAVELGDCTREEIKASRFSRRLGEIIATDYERFNQRRHALQAQRAREKEIALTPRECLELTCQARADLQEEGFDLDGVYCREMIYETRPRIRAFLAYRCGFCTYYPGLHDALWHLLLCVIQEQDHLTEPHIMQNLAFTMTQNRIDPYLLWSTVTESGMEKLIFDMYRMLGLFPYEQIEALLLQGIGDERWRISFAAMEAIRYLAGEDSIDKERFSGALLDAIHRFPDRSLYHIEAIGALGCAHPLLSQLVIATDHDGIRRDAAQCVVLNCDRETSLAQIRHWLGQGGAVQKAAIQALGILPGEEARNLLDLLFSESRNQEEMQALLEAMSGRKDDFTSCFFEAIDASHDLQVRLQGIKGLIACTLAKDRSNSEATDRDLVERLRHAAMHDPCGEARGLALMALGLRNGTAETGFFQERWIADDDPVIRYVAGISLAIFASGDPRVERWLDLQIEGEINDLVRHRIKAFQMSLASGEEVAWLRDHAEKLEKLSAWTAPFTEENSAKNPLALQTAYYQKMLELVDRDS